MCAYLSNTPTRMKVQGAGTTQVWLVYGYTLSTENSIYIFFE